MSEILISEIFGPTIQGEGALVGRQTIFVRTGGCDFRCSWCDTLYAVLPEYKASWRKQDAAQILEEIANLSRQTPILVTISGGNPALQPLGPLLEMGAARGFSFALETQGTSAPEWFSRLDYLVISPKPPSSGMAFCQEKLANCVRAAGKKPQISLKVVVFNDADFEFARRVGQLYPDLPFFLSVGNPTPGKNRPANHVTSRNSVEWLLEKCAQSAWTTPTILPQLHVLLWGSERGR